MANDDVIGVGGGLVPVQQPYGNVRVTPYRVTTSATIGFYRYQPVTLDANGRAAFVTCASNNAVLGSIVGFLDTSKGSIPSGMASLTQGAYLPANTDAIALVADDPEQLFMIQEDTGSTVLSETAIGNIFALTCRDASGSTVTGVSQYELDRSTGATDTGNQLKLVGLVDKMNSDGSTNTWGNYAKLLVKIYRHSLAGIWNPGV